MKKGKIFLLMASMVLVAIFTFSCSSNNSPELVAQSSGSEEATQSNSSEDTAQSSSSEWTAQSSSSEETAQSSSSEWTAQSSSSEGTAKSSSSEETALSSSSEETTQSSSSEEMAQSSSSEWTAQSSSSEETARSSSSSNSSSSSGNTTFGTAGFWFLTTDESNDGTSTVGNAKDGDGNYIVLVQDGGNSVAKIQNYSLGRALYDAKMNQYPAYVDMSLNLKNNNEYKDILSCEGGFIYKYKGVAHRFRTKLSTVTDYNYHYATISASEDWKTAIISIGDLKQESSGASRPFDFGRLDSLSWYLRDGLSSKTGDLAVYNVKCAANCDGKAYDSETHKCEEGYIIGKNESICNGVAYDPVMQFCDGNNIVDKCGGSKYNPATQFCENSSVKNGLKDSRDGKVYKIVQIGEQVWMAENLNYNSNESKCYDNQMSYCDKYGRLYDLETAKIACPTGWHLPTVNDWSTLIKFVNPTCIDYNSYRQGLIGKICDDVGAKLKARDDWPICSSYFSCTYGTDNYGFTALPGGHGFWQNYFRSSGVGEDGSWWGLGASVNSFYYYKMTYDSGAITVVSSGNIIYHSVRCVLN